MCVSQTAQVCLQSLQWAQGLLLCEELPFAQLSQWGLQLIRKLQKGRREERQLQVPPPVSTQDAMRAAHDGNQCRRGGSTARVTGESHGHLRALGLRDWAEWPARPRGCANPSCVLGHVVPCSIATVSSPSPSVVGVEYRTRAWTSRKAQLDWEMVFLLSGSLFLSTWAFPDTITVNYPAAPGPTACSE